jgi:glutamate racemase
MKAQTPIGIFDSGIGGTSIWREVNALMPQEDTLYLADSARAPYGQRSKEEIIRYCVENTEWLLEKGCKIIVVACNTATTNAIDHLRSHFSIPFIGIEPAIKPAALHTRSGVVGVLATRGTLTSQLFERTSSLYASGIEVIEQVGDGLVELIENGNLESDEMTVLLNRYLQPMMTAGIDSLVLGCTHYPYLIPQIIEILGSEVTIIDSGEAVARQTRAVLDQHRLCRSDEHIGNHHFFTTGETHLLKAILQDDRIEIEKVAN